MIKQFLSLTVLAAVLVSCNGAGKLAKTTETANQPTTVDINLVNVANDKVKVMVNPGAFTTETTTFYIPETVPGTYSTDDYGRLIDNVVAYNYSGETMPVKEEGENAWAIADAKTFDYITYEVNDSYDIEGELEIFSPSGTNIEKGQNFLLNLHGFVGYFQEKMEMPYSLAIKRPTNLFVSSALPKEPSAVRTDGTFELDQFTASRYFQVIDNPIMYSKTAPSEFMIDDMKVVVDVYSPTDLFTAEKVSPNLEEMMRAQKDYLGDINDTPLYAIMVYLSKMNGNDAGGFGALEHHTSTVVVLPEAMPVDYFNQTMTDVVSHEFFHTLTPLNVHSKEIHYFDYNDPEMSEHLWMYEGVTEYFANHFQVHEGLITPEDFYERMMGKIRNSKNYTDDMSFTEMSRNVLKEGYKDEYANVYEKGALIAMALDIRLRELSGGEMSVLQLMGRLSEKYGKDKPFNDEDLIPTIVSLTYPEIQDFFDAYVIGNTPIPYKEFFAKVGLDMGTQERETNMFLMDMQIPFIHVNEESKEIFFDDDLPTNSMLTKLGIEPGDVIQSVNGENYDLDSIRGLIMSSMSWEPGSDFEMVVLRDKKPTTLKAVYETPMFEQESIVPMDLPANDNRVGLREAWLFSK